VITVNSLLGDWATLHQGLLNLPSLRGGKWVLAVAGKAKTGMARSDCGWMQGVQVKTVIPWQCVLYLSALETLRVEALYKLTTFTFFNTRSTFEILLWRAFLLLKQSFTVSEGRQKWHDSIQNVQLMINGQTLTMALFCTVSEIQRDYRPKIANYLYSHVFSVPADGVTL